MALHKCCEATEIVGRMNSPRNVFYIFDFEHLDMRTSSEKVKYMLVL
jgi:hypothetical protein